MAWRVTLNVLLLVASGCTTSFKGSAQVEGGRSGCERKCASIGMQMQAFVFMGEYSTACVCDLPGHAAHANAGPASSAVAGAVWTHLQQPLE